MVIMDVDNAVDVEINVSASASAPVKEMSELRYSRLIHTLGRDAVNALSQARVLVLGCKGSGVEVAKNLVLSGVQGLGLVDDEVVVLADLGAHFLLSEGDVGRNRAVATAQKLKEMYPSVNIVTLSSVSVESALGSYGCVVATSGFYPDLIRLNSLCRSLGVPFVAASCRGVFTFVFSDFGDNFSVLDETGELAGAVLVEGITQDFPATVTVVEEQRHGLENGDEVVLSGIKGMEELNRDTPYSVTVTGVHSFTIQEDTRSYERYVSGGYFSKLKKSKNMEFLSLEKALLSPKFCISDPVKEPQVMSLHVGFQAVDEFERRHASDTLSPSRSTAINPEQFQEVVVLAQEIWSNLQALHVEKGTSSGSYAMEATSDERGEELSNEALLKANGERDRPYQDRAGSSSSGGSTSSAGLPSRSHGNRFEVIEEIVRMIALGASVELYPVSAVTGGIAAQEAIKALTRVFTPIQQWLYFDAVECLPSVPLAPEDTLPCGSRYDHQIALFGREFQDKLGCLQWLVVGAGGIGCEALKGLVLMGVGCSSNGSITITDMDTVSKPNLIDQVLYQLEDVGRAKAPSAARALRTINPAAQIHALTERFDTETETIFDSSFFNSIAGVFSAVDTSSSRLYLDTRCVSNRRPMVDGGKHGTKGSVQVFVPFQTEMYASTRDPPEHKELPICTLRNFPYATEHTLRWAVETFEALFKSRPADVNAYLSSRDFQESIRKSPASSRLPVLNSLRDALIRYRPISFDACIQWARLQFEDLFSNNIKQLCFNFPASMTTTAGAPFWSGTKRCPTPITFDPADNLHLDFIIAAANLQATIYGLKGCQDRAMFVDVLQRVVVPPFEPKGYRLVPVEFEKDDEHNYHAEFVAAASSLRGRNYGIPSTNKLQARLVGGRVLPSIATSTAVVGGLMCLELYKLVQGKPFTLHKHAYFNLAVPLFAFAQPIKALQHTVSRKHLDPLIWTLWDRFEMDCQNMTLETFLAEFKRQQGLEITMLSFGKSLLYAEFLPRKKLQDRMPLSLIDLITTIGKVTLPPTETTIAFSISCTDAKDEDVEVPDVVAKVR
uniref:Ubiquitin-activating enzyme E1 C-terminal domain-containing protein n=1 Tax=Physcomitrium patens TaxID=3218 RepID=A0A7I4DHT6_PHYPA